MLWSQSVQHSAAGNQKIFERMKARGVDPSKMSKEDLIRETYAERAAYAGQFANVGTRYSREVEDVLAVNAATQETKTTDLTKRIVPHQLIQLLLILLVPHQLIQLLLILLYHIS